MDKPYKYVCVVKIEDIDTKYVFVYCGYKIVFNI